jgi:Tol biopolymer transport system component
MAFAISVTEKRMPLKPGFVLRNRYRIESILGQGGMGAVYKAVDVNLGVTVAVKENLFTTEEFARQFRREATILASLRHPNLPRVTDHFVVEGEGQYLVMDFVQGDDLRQRLERGGAVSEAEALPWFLDTADALAYLHGRTPPVLHRDVKPGNIKITPEGRAVLVDFGLAKVVEEDSATTTGAKAMTPGFSPPEQYGSGRTDPRTDVYSLGATLYAALTAAIPEDSLERAMGRAELTPVRKRSPGVSVGLARVVEKALAVKPEDRFQSVADMADALGASTSASRPTVVRSYPHLEQTRVAAGKTVVAQRGTGGLAPVRRRRRWPFLVLAVLTVAVTAGGAIYALTDDGPQAQTTPPGATQPGASLAPADTLAFPAPTDTIAALTAAASPSPEAGATLTVPASGPTPMGGGIGQVAFASTRAGLPQIFLANVDGTGVRQLTTMTDGACQPAWSPDGQQLVFTSPCRDDQDRYPGASLWLIQADGSGLTSLPTLPGGDFDPAWSPDGAGIAFASLRENPSVPNLFLISPLGTDVRRLTEGSARDQQPAWAPTGTQLVFVSERSGQGELWILPDFGSSAVSFSRDPVSEKHPAWSHDGRTIVFERKIGGIPRLVALAFDARAGGGVRICPEGPLATQPMATPKWSPDDRWLVFETWPDGVNHEIAVMTSSCTNYGLLTSDPALDFDPAWRP